jgi:predicted nucleic acid-binding protein
VSFLADTNVLSELRKRTRANPNVRAWMETNGWRAIHTSWIAVAELRRGVALVRRRDPAQATALDHWISEIIGLMEDRIFPVDGAVAEIWARLMVPNPRPAMDTLIAATAAVQGLTLATRNVRDFEGSGLEVFDPWSYEG